MSWRPGDDPLANLPEPGGSTRPTPKVYGLKGKGAAPAEEPRQDARDDDTPTTPQREPEPPQRKLPLGPVVVTRRPRRR